MAENTKVLNDDERKALQMLIEKKAGSVRAFASLVAANPEKTEYPEWKRIHRVISGEMPLTTKTARLIWQGLGLKDYDELMRILKSGNRPQRADRAARAESNQQKLSPKPSSITTYVDRMALLVEKIELPLLSSNAELITLPMSAIPIDLPLRLTRDHRRTGPLVEGEDAEFVGKYYRQSHTDILKRQRQFDMDRQRVVRLGQCLADHPRQIVVGDPASGKTTLIRSVAYAYAMRHSSKAGASTPCPQFPGGHSHRSLPDRPWLPVLLLCRKLNSARFDTGLRSIIESQLRYWNEEANSARSLANELSEMLVQGEAILLVDGLDEIRSADRRRQFAEVLSDAAKMAPQMPMVLTSRVTGYRAIQETLLADFNHLNVAPLGESEQRQFIAAAVPMLMTGLSEEDRARERKSIESVVCQKERVTELCDQIFFLALIVQMHCRGENIPASKWDICRRAIELILRDQRETLARPLTLQEIWPYLETVAYQMQAQGDSEWPESKILDAVQKLQSSQRRNHEFRGHRKPKEWLESLLEKTEILTLARDSDGEDPGGSPRVVQFFHRSLQEYFAGQALLHGRISRCSSDLRERLCERIGNFTFEDCAIGSNGKWGTELVASDDWQESVLACIASIDADKAVPAESRTHGSADDALLLLLPTPSELDPRVARARAAFSALALADEPAVTARTAGKVIRMCIDELSQFDAHNHSVNTSMDAALRKLANSRWGPLLREQLLDRFVACWGDKRRQIGGVLATHGGKSDSKGGNLLKELLETLCSGSFRNRVSAALGLMELFYRQSSGIHGTGVSLTREEQGAVKDALLGAIARADDHGGAVTSAAIWALGWFTDARDVASEGFPTLDDSERRRMLELALDRRIDESARAWAVLMACPRQRDAYVAAQQDWIYKWAVVADGGQRQSALPRPKPLDSQAEVAVLRPLLQESEFPVVQKWVALLLGRFGLFSDEGADLLGALALDVLRDDKTREEAWIYLGLTGGPKVESFLRTGPPKSANPGDTYGNDRFLLAAMAISNADFQREMLLSKMEQDQSSIDPHAYVLAGMEDPRGRTMLVELKDNSNEKVRLAVGKALAKAELWWKPTEGKKVEPA